MLNVLLVTVLAAASGGGVLLSSADLAAMDSVVIVDAREVAVFESAHIAGARNVPVSALSEARDGVPNLLKPLPQLESILQNAGLDPEKPVVVYSGMEGGKDLHLATRLFWILEYLGYRDVRLLDGGLAKWQAEGGAIETGTVKPEPIEPLNLTPDPAKLATKEEVAAVAEDGSRQLLDLRSQAQYFGDERPGSATRAGRIPGACNLPAEESLGADKTFKPVEELKTVAARQGLEAGKPVTTYCNTGRSASVGYFLLRHLGYDDVALYDGSMSEWSRDETKEVETGTTP
jgi:thiosulfate/3-mercaptopyruvate sulfurtransferase